MQFDSLVVHIFLLLLLCGDIELNPGPKDGVRVDKVKRELENVLNEKQVYLHDTFTVTPDTLGEIARELSAVNIINRAVKRAPTYDAIIDSFVNGMKLKKEISGVEEYCKKFLKALSNIGGPVDDAASMITDEWTKAVKEKCGVDLTLGDDSSGYDDTDFQCEAEHAAKDDILNPGLMKKEPKDADLLKIFQNYQHEYRLVGVCLEVQVDDLLPLPHMSMDNLILVFKRWKAADNDVTWEKIATVCKDNAPQLGKVHSNLKKFLSSEEALMKY